tara:strand:- start:625 stop:1347 length:723 start_codon:yes stop_codon:yes gene_type:complete
MEGKPFKLRSGNKPAFKMMGAKSPVTMKKAPTTMKKAPATMKSPMEKQLVGNQKNLNEGLKKAIEAAPGKMKSPMTKKKDAIGPKGSATIPSHIREVYPKLTNEAYNKDKAFYDKASQAVIKSKKSPATMKKEGAMKMKKESMAKMKKNGAMKMKKESMAKMKEPMKMKKESMAKMKKESAMKQKMNMVKGPDGKMVPDFAVDGKGANDMKSGAKMKMKKDSATKMKKESMAKLKKKSAN